MGIEDKKRRKKGVETNETGAFEAVEGNSEEDGCIAEGERAERITTIVAHHSRAGEK
jgi:hypothetical protein